MRVALMVMLFGVAGAACSGDDDDDGGTPLDDTLRGGVIPAFDREGCLPAGCHSTSPGGNLVLGGSGVTADQVYANLMLGGDTEQLGGAAVVNTANDAASTILTEPLMGDPAVHDGGKQFSSTSEETYQAILNWITAGAQNN